MCVCVRESGRSCAVISGCLMNHLLPVNAHLFQFLWELEKMLYEAWQSIVTNRGENFTRSLLFTVVCGDNKVVSCWLGLRNFCMGEKYRKWSISWAKGVCKTFLLFLLESVEYWGDLCPHVSVCVSFIGCKPFAQYFSLRIFTIRPAELLPACEWDPCECAQD